jgi:hypothetical protein
VNVETITISKSMARVIITDKLASYGAAKQDILRGVEHWQHKCLNNRAENSHQLPIDIAQPAAHMRVYGAVIVFGMHRGETTRDGRHPVAIRAAWRMVSTDVV